MIIAFPALSPKEEKKELTELIVPCLVPQRKDKSTDKNKLSWGKQLACFVKLTLVT